MTEHIVKKGTNSNIVTKITRDRNRNKFKKASQPKKAQKYKYMCEDSGS